MNSKYRIGFLCAGAAFFLFITLAYKMTYDYTMDKYMEKVSERNEDVQKADGIGKTESIAAEGEAVKGGNCTGKANCNCRRIICFFRKLFELKSKTEKAGMIKAAKWRWT